MARRCSTNAGRVAQLILCRDFGTDQVVVEVQVHGRLCAQPQVNEPLQARHWLEQAAAQGSQEAQRLLKQLPEH